MISSVWLCCELAEYIPSKYAGELNKIVTETANSKITIVRKYAAFSMRFILKDKCPFVQLAINSLKKLIEDPQDVVKVFATQTLCHHKHPKAFFMKNVYPFLEICLDQTSWRIQHAILTDLENIVLSIQSNNKKKVLDFYLNAMKSEEEEIVVIAFSVLKNVAAFLDPEFIIQKILPLLKDASLHQNLQIRIAVAASLPCLAPVIGKNHTSKTLKDLILELLKDKENAVKLEIFNNIAPLDSVLPIQQIMGNFIPVINELLNDQNWMIRESTIKSLKVFFGKNEEGTNNEDSFIQFLKDKLSDRVYQVRKTTLEEIKNLCSILGTKWAEEKGLNILSDFQKNGNYLYRLNYLFGMAMIYPFLSESVLEKEINNVCQLSKDPVPNIRMNVIRTLLIIYGQNKTQNVEDKIVKIVKYLENDEDHYISNLVKKITNSGFKTAAEAIISEDYQFNNYLFNVSKQFFQF